LTKHEPDHDERSSTQRDKLLRIKLVNDVAQFEKQLAELKSNGSYANFTDIQTLKELIQARQEMLKRMK
jgi:hypothetical protein